jgi:uncharacterized protein YjbJ (UPF0337 family)
MNQDILEGKWNQMRGEVRTWWGKLTDDDLNRVKGNLEKLSGALQERYGYSKQEAQSEIDKFLKRLENIPEGQTNKDW